MDSPMLRHGHRSSLESRLASFSTFHQSQVLRVPVEDLAADGLYFTGAGNKLACCGCRFTAYWLSAEDPRMSHWLSCPDCFMANKFNKLALEKFFSAEDKRVLTYPENWESRCCFSRRQLAKAGFCYSGGRDPFTTVDRVWCFSCNISLKSWKPSDDPLAEHRKDCGFSKLLAFGDGEDPWSSGYQSAELMSSQSLHLKSDDVPTIPPDHC